MTNSPESMSADDIHSGADSSKGLGSMTPSARPKIKSTACRRCHARKVKCSGGQPCQNCRQANKHAECTYPRRNRQVKVGQKYIDDLLDEIKRLKSEVNSRQAAAVPPPSESSLATETLGTVGSSSRRASIDASDPARSVSYESKPWFMDVKVFHTPIFIGEAADAAWATRFRQAIIDTSSRHAKHLPRVNYAQDQQLMYLADSDVPWPSPSRSRFLVEVSLKYVSRSYHVVRRSSVLENLEQSIHNPSWGGAMMRCKFWGLFAIGELYSTRSVPPGKEFPGMAYFAKASKMLGVLDERPSLDSIEIMHLLSFYSLALNRRYSSYFLSGTAVRLAVVMGLHLNVPKQQLRDSNGLRDQAQHLNVPPAQLMDPAIREHRNRVWWTTYIFDRMWASKHGHPVAVQDDDIELDLPTNPEVDASVAADFGDAAYYIASLKLAGVTTKVVRSIYGRRNQQSMLSTRVQQALKDLRDWVEALPSHLSIDSPSHADSVPKPVPLHLSFNQCAILATRPVLLHVLRTHVSCWPSTDPVTAAQVPASAMTLSETCIRCARHSCRLLRECWIDGSFATFDYFYTQYLFSSLCVLAVASLLDGKESRSDREQFEEAAQFLAQLKEAGSFAAQEFSGHIDAIKACMETAHAKKGGLVLDTTGAGAGTSTATTPFAGPIAQFDQPFQAQTTTSGMALAEPSLQELLAQPVLDLQFLEGSAYDDFTQGLYWPEIGPETWSPETWAPT